MWWRIWGIQRKPASCLHVLCSSSSTAAVIVLWDHFVDSHSYGVHLKIACQCHKANYKLIKRLGLRMIITGNWDTFGLNFLYALLTDAGPRLAKYDTEAWTGESNCQKIKPSQWTWCTPRGNAHWSFRLIPITKTHREVYNNLSWWRWTKFVERYRRSSYYYHLGLL